jgi:hypothetical protein
MQFHSEIDEIFGGKPDRDYVGLKQGDFIYFQFSDDPSFLLSSEILEFYGSWARIKYQNGDQNGVWCSFEHHGGTQQLVIDGSSYGPKPIADHCFVKKNLSISEPGQDRPLDSRTTWVNLVGVGNRNNSEHMEYEYVYRETEVDCIADLHGDLEYLRRSLLKQDIIDRQDNWIAGNRVVVFLGDYIDEPDGLKVKDYLVSLSEKAAKAGGCVKLLCGNHEAEAFGAMMAYSVSRNPNDRLDEARREHIFQNFLDAHGGRAFLNGEVNKRFGVNTRDPMKLLSVLKKSGYIEFIKSLELCTQVDDSLFVHAGIDVESSRMIRDLGVDGVNKQWRQALVDVETKGDFTSFGHFNRRSHVRSEVDIDVTPQGGMLWFDAVDDLKALKVPQIQEICANLKSRGINNVVVGHTVFQNTSLVRREEFAKYGIKIICADVGGSEAIGFKGSPKRRRPDELRERTSCGIKVGRRGDISGSTCSFDEDPIFLHIPAPDDFAKQPSPEFTSTYNTVYRLIRFAVPSDKRVSLIEARDNRQLKREIAKARELIDTHYRPMLENPMFETHKDVVFTGDHNGELARVGAELSKDRTSPRFRVLIQVLIMHTQSQIELMEKRLLRFR